MCPSAVLLLLLVLQVVKAITCGLFMNAAQYVRTEYDPAKTNDAGSNVYRLLRHVQPRELPHCCLPVGLAGVVVRVRALLQLVAFFPVLSLLMHMHASCRVMRIWRHPMLNRVCCALCACVLCFVCRPAAEAARAPVFGAVPHAAAAGGVPGVPAERRGLVRDAGRDGHPAGVADRAGARGLQEGLTGQCEGGGGVQLLPPCVA